MVVNKAHVNTISVAKFAGLAFGLLLLVATFLSIPAVAQTQNADVIGSVQDPQGAVIPGAEVKLVEQTRGTIFRAVTTGDGTYQIAGVSQGTYRLEVSMAGFKTQVVPNLVLRASVLKRVDVTLEVGQVTQQVTVTDVAPAIETQKPTIGGAVPNIATVQGHPLVGFSVWSGIGMVGLVPGAAAA